MKKNLVIIISLLFFFLINTSYFWEGKLELYAFPCVLILLAVYIGLLVAFLKQVFLLIGDEFKPLRRWLILALLLFVLTSTYYKPNGLIDFQKFEGEAVLLAEREGAANCLTTFRLKDDFSFKERIGCFGISETKGNFKMVHDTIFFQNVQARDQEDAYKFGIIRKSKFQNKKILEDLVLYKSLNDTIGYELWITKNELYKLQEKNQRLAR